ncbi:MAG: cysteine peptidase family C39 domain-containing protein [Planctomycetaceae bacterium]
MTLALPARIEQTTHAKGGQVHDIRLAIGLMVMLSIGVYFVTLRLLRNRSKLFLDVIAAVIVVLTLAYVRFIWDQLWIVNWIPLPSAIVLTNWFPLLLSALAATVWLRLSPGSLARRAPAMMLMIAAAVYSVMYFVPTEVPVCQDEWMKALPPLQHAVCVQTNDHTCSPAAAATILVALGIDANEQEMARLCMTSKRGTTWLGLYHGLATKLLGSGYRVEFFQAHTSDLQNLSAEFPLLLCCELNESDADMVPKYVSDDGWKPGVAHSVVYFGTVGQADQHVIGDPSRGYEIWTAHDLGLLWTGTGLRIRKLSDKSTAAKTSAGK